jgi:hypothetical protein
MMRRWHWWANLLALTFVAWLLLAPAALAAVPGPTPTPTATPDPNYPINTPCLQVPPGIVIGLPQGTPTPIPTVGTPVGSPTPAPSPTPLPACQWPQQNSSTCQGWHLDLPLGGGICIAWKAWITEVLQGFALALGAAAQTAFTWVQGALTYTPDLTGYGDLAGLYASMRDLGSALFVGFFMLAAIRYFLTSLGADSFYEAVGAMRRGIVGAMLLQALGPLLHGWFAGVNAVAAAINSAPAGQDMGTFAADVLGIDSLIVGSAGLLAPEVLTAAILLAVVFLVLITAVTVMRLTGLFILACLYVVAPACLVTWVSPEFKGIARWWFASFVSYSLWGVAYALVLKVDVVLLTSNGGPPTDGSAAGKAVIAALMGLAGLVALWRVPRIMDSLLGGLASGSAGVSVIPGAAVRVLTRAGV